jgi:hypothetical protein
MQREWLHLSVCPHRCQIKKKYDELRIKEDVEEVVMLYMLHSNFTKGMCYLKSCQQKVIKTKMSIPLI